MPSVVAWSPDHDPCGVSGDVIAARDERPATQPISSHMVARILRRCLADACPCAMVAFRPADEVANTPALTFCLDLHQPAPRSVIKRSTLRGGQPPRRSRRRLRPTRRS